jgi:rhodanese-related sulfurtransferase
MEHGGTRAGNGRRTASRGVALGWALALVLGAPVAGGLVGAGCASPAQSQQWIEPERAAALVASGATLLDVRTPGEFASGHPEAAVNVPVDEVASRLAEIDRARPVVVYCAAGVRSARAAEVLRAQGYEVHDLGTVGRWSGR